jgi:hypothetical protein
MRPSIRLALILMFSLSGCQIGSDVKISSVDGFTIFTVMVNSKTPICVSGISVGEGNGELGRVDKWILNQNYSDIVSGKNNCDNIFIFGKGKKGYEEKYDGSLLEPGKTYYVDFGGPGFGGMKTFVATK